MPCESYQSALTEAAAGAPATAALRAHLIVCAECRAALAAEGALLASIDSGLRRVANAEVPASLIPSVRARLAEEKPKRFNWLSAWAVAGAALVAGIVIASVMQFHKAPVGVNKATPEVAANPAQPAPSVTPAINSLVPHKSQLVRAAKPLTAVSLASAKSPLVLVPPDERQAFARFLSTVETRPALAAALAQTKQPEVERPVTTDLIVIAALEVKPLQGAAESSELKEK